MSVQASMKSVLKRRLDSPVGRLLWPWCVVPAASALLLIGTIWFSAASTAHQQAQRLDLTSGASGWEPIVGAPVEASGARQYRLDSQGRLLLQLSSEPIKASDYAYLSVEVDGSPLLHWSLGWRTSTSGARVHRLSLQPEASVTELSAHPQWSGLITELLLIARPDYGALSRPEALKVSIREVTIQSGLSEWERISAWLAASDAFVGWDMRSVHSLRGSQMVALVLAWVALSAAGFFLFGWRRQRSAWMATGCVLVLGWVVLDVVWSQQLLRQLTVTRDQFSAVSHDQRPFYDLDAGLARFLQPVSDWAPRRVLVFADDKYYALRARYHLLPIPAARWRDPEALLRRSSRLKNGDIIVVYGVENRREVAEALARSGRGIDVLRDDDRGAIYRIGQLAREG